MPRIAAVPTVIAVVAAIGFGALALTTYTFPIEGAASDPALYALIAGALHDPQPASRPLLGVSPLPLTSADSEATDLGHRLLRSDPVTSPLPDEAAAWAATAAGADSGALRDWLGRWVLATTTTSHDTVRLTLHRWSQRPGCPWLSTLVATTTGVARNEWRLVRITATCPPPPEGPSVRDR